MGSSIDIVFDRKVAGYSPDDRCSLAHVFFEPSFEEIANQLSVRPLTDFFSDEPDSLDHEIDDPVVREELKKQLGPAQYFSPAEGLVSVRALIARIQKEPLQLVRSRRNLSQNLLAELAEVEKSLQLANEMGAKFYFKLDL